MNTNYIKNLDYKILFQDSSHLIIASAIRGDERNKGEEKISICSEISTSSDKGLTLLVWAVLNKSSWAVSKIIESGGDVNQGSLDGYTPLMFAILARWNEGIANLLSLGADPNITNYEKDSPLHLAVDRVVSADSNEYDRALDVVYLLLTHGSDVNTSNNLSNTPLILASMFADEKCMDMLTQFGANPTIRNLSGRSAVDYLSKINK